MAVGQGLSEVPACPQNQPAAGLELVGADSEAGRQEVFRWNKALRGLEAGPSDEFSAALAYSRQATGYG